MYVPPPHHSSWGARAVVKDPHPWWHGSSCPLRGWFARVDDVRPQRSIASVSGRKYRVSYSYDGLYSVPMDLCVTYAARQRPPLFGL